MTGIYPGSFDPVTNGHLDIANRAARLSERLIIAVLKNSAKKPLFSLEERVEMLRGCIDAPNVQIMAFDGLLMDFARQQRADFIVRGLRAISDFEAEFAMANMNKHLAPEIDTVFLMTSTQWSYLSSSMIKEVAQHKADIASLVPPVVAKRLFEKYSK